MQGLNPEVLDVLSFVLHCVCHLFLPTVVYDVCVCVCVCVCVVTAKNNLWPAPVAQTKLHLVITGERCRRCVPVLPPARYNLISVV